MEGHARQTGKERYMHMWWLFNRLTWLCPPFSPGGRRSAKAASKDKSRKWIKQGRQSDSGRIPASFPNMKESAFVVIDKNGDGAIDRVEWMNFSKATRRA